MDLAREKSGPWKKKKSIDDTHICSYLSLSSLGILESFSRIRDRCTYLNRSNCRSFAVVNNRRPQQKLEAETAIVYGESEKEIGNGERSKSAIDSETENQRQRSTTLDNKKLSLGKKEIGNGRKMTDMRRKLGFGQEISTERSPELDREENPRARRRREAHASSERRNQNSELDVDGESRLSGLNRQGKQRSRGLV
ncbi:PREDICTED: uncharacterized protein LOC104825597 [Tarenaya hassleriana]|uniref:uncharacterized protein LOC104825597 n=1 Tax=Tarenaya hassleriana TaxID=28532 RepID=UPI00053C13FC|nr:PREDICTED: uncharacterized protein LOC104825597 [Tarenaya hassleriana]